MREVYVVESLGGEKCKKRRIERALSLEIIEIAFDEIAKHVTPSISPVFAR